MKTTILTIALLLTLALPVMAQETSLPPISKAAPPITLDTNSSPPVLSGPIVDLFHNLSAATNWGVALFGIKADDSYGAGILALYNINQWVATGVGLDWLRQESTTEDQITMPSGQVQFQAPFTLYGKVTMRPFAFTGIATPISGEGEDNGSVVGLFGAGLGMKVYGGLHAFYAIEQRTGQPSAWNLFGLAWSKSF